MPGAPYDLIYAADGGMLAAPANSETAGGCGAVVDSP
jgi:hypothetical protein